MMLVEQRDILGGRVRMSENQWLLDPDYTCLDAKVHESTPEETTSAQSFGVEME